jgi:hypothetical protein
MFKLLNEQGMWHELLHNKYLHKITLSQVQVKLVDSPFWKGVTHGRDEFFQRGYFIVGDGQNVRFWKDPWLGKVSLADRYPSLYDIVNTKNKRVAEVLANNPLHITFRRVLMGEHWEAWLDLVCRIMNVQLSDELDKFIWNLTTSGNFSVKLLYADYMNGHMVFLNKYIWKLKVPLKIRMFMWFLHRKVLLTKDNLTKRKWLGCNKCAFCDQDESIEHLFIRCTFSKLVWRVVHFTFNLPPPTNVKKLFGNWLNGLDKHTKLHVRIGLCAIMWAICYL